MKSAFNDNHAGTKAARIARIAARTALACALAFGAGGASAQQHGDRRDDQGMQQRERFSLPQQDREGRQSEARANDDMRRAQQQDQQEQREATRRAGSRLTPDERRDLRRQINEANMDMQQRRR
ncbi:hypothetical protein HH212_16340 [Massilia forsythiae]|uniref:DUF4148 domain-containing protein n=1 Tax=Massilia forsythiae TaxID=2728020 RepID=A0A7Z2VYH1_9BURK|nr:hypothetical protein [Massilia forsythiae]QJE01410.1 hypothetical protein HH212_16340 [Massilia forsythiae]